MFTGGSVVERVAMPSWRVTIAAWVGVCIALIVSTAGVLAQDSGQVVRADFPASHIDVVPFLGAVQSDRKQVVIQLPANSAGQSESMNLQATGAGPQYRWAIFTTANPSDVERELVIDAARQSFPGSGIASPSYSSSRISAASSSRSVTLRRLNTPDRDAFAFTVPPKTSLTVALELSEVGVSGVRLWHRTAFDHNAYRQALYRGIVLGMAMLAVVVITCLVLLSPQIVFPLSMIFAVPAVGFITLETSQLEAALGAVLPQVLVPRHEVLSAIIEALMMAGVMFLGVTIMRTRRQLPTLSGLLIFAGGAGIALAVYALIEPVLVKQIVRVGFTLGVVTVLAASAILAHRGGVRAKSSLMVWILLGLWTAAAGNIAVMRPPSELASPVLVGGLALVLVALAFILAYFAFSSALNPEQDALEAERNALALASASQVVWDFEPGDKSFFVGAELEKVLGYEDGSLDNTDAKSWLALIHPNDHNTYFAALEVAKLRGNQHFDLQLRVRHADGRYRWYTLKGSSLPNGSETGLRLTGVLSDSSQQRNSQNRLLSDAIFDVVTGLPNYALYLDRVSQATNRAISNAELHLSVLIVDIDRFNVVNDRLGQEIGDSLLKTIARRIEKLLPATSSLARMPGDQFAVILESSAEQDAMETAIIFVDKVRHAVSQPVRVPPNEIYLTCCVGVAHWDSKMGSADVFHRCADTALFEAKTRGKDKVAFYKPGMLHEATSSGLGIEDLQIALQERSFELLYQPIMRLADRQLAGFEALVRLRKPDGEILEPSSFLPLAERCGLIGEIGAFVLTESARQLGVWQRMFSPAQPVFVAVNVSSSQLSGPRLLHLARTVLSREELVPGSLKLEITETMVMENPELSLQMLDRLKAMGIGLSCDDFGTGYSSLSYLRRLPFDTLKVDRSFLQAGLETDRGSVILDAIILLAHDLGLQVVAEGVETQAQLDHLVTLECDLAQGFLIGEPIDAQQVLAALGAPSRETASSQSGIAALWNRLTRRQSVVAPPPVAMEPEPEPDEEELDPWSPYDFHPAPWAPRVANPAYEKPARSETHDSDVATASQVNGGRPPDEPSQGAREAAEAGLETVSHRDGGIAADIRSFRERLNLKPEPLSAPAAVDRPAREIKPQPKSNPDTPPRPAAEARPVVKGQPVATPKPAMDIKPQPNSRPAAEPKPAAADFRPVPEGETAEPPKPVGEIDPGLKSRSEKAIASDPAVTSAQREKPAAERQAPAATTPDTVAAAQDTVEAKEEVASGTKDAAADAKDGKTRTDQRCKPEVPQKPKKSGATKKQSAKKATASKKRTATKKAGSG